MATKTHPVTATSRARAIIAERHPEEYAEILGDERQKIGLSRIPGGPTKVSMEQQIAKQQQKLEALLEQYGQSYGNSD